MSKKLKLIISAAISLSVILVSVFVVSRLHQPQPTYEIVNYNDKMLCEVITDDFTLSSLTVSESGCYLRLNVTLSLLEDLKQTANGERIIIHLDETDPDPNYDIELEPEVADKLISIFKTYRQCHSLNLVKALPEGTIAWQNEVPRDEYCVATFFNAEDLTFMLDELESHRANWLMIYRRLTPGDGRLAELPFAQDELIAAYYGLQSSGKPYMVIMTTVESAPSNGQIL